MRADLDATLTALADPVRREAIRRLRSGPRRASALADSLSLSRPAMSRHLRILRGAGLVEQHVLDEDARVRMVELRREPFVAVRRWLDEVEAFWSEQLGAFKAHAESRKPGRRR